jgi:ribosomal protein S18 acetylase RimI-like enzyme
MYVNPGFRGGGAGRRLAERLLSHARAAGYALMKLDTESEFTAAVTLYRSLGFVECPRYNDDPMPGTLWMSLRL